MVDFQQIRQRAGSSVPRVHGNGFIQLDLEQGSRLHVWGHPSVPRQKVDTGIHDHRFGFRSSVIRGRVMNVVWHSDVGADPTHKVYVARAHSPQSHNTMLIDTGDRKCMFVSRSEMIVAGDEYVMRPLIFHETVTDRPSATIMQKTEEVPEHQARVLVPMGQQPDNAFDRDLVLSAERLWEIIEDVLQGASCVRTEKGDTMFEDPDDGPGTDIPGN